MPPKTTTRPTDAEHALFKAILMNLKTKPEVDWEAVVEATSYSSVRSAMERFRQHREACGAKYEGSGPSRSTSLQKKDTTSKADAAETPAKGKGKVKKAKAAVASAKTSFDFGGEPEEEEGEIHLGDNVKDEVESDHGSDTFNEEEEV